MARKVKFNGTVGATVNMQSLRIGEHTDPEKLPVASRKMLESTMGALAINGWQCVIIRSENGKVTIADRDNPTMQATLEMGILGYPVLNGPLGLTTNDNGNKVVLAVKAS